MHHILRPSCQSSASACSALDQRKRNFVLVSRPCWDDRGNCSKMQEVIWGAADISGICQDHAMYPDLEQINLFILLTWPPVLLWGSGLLRPCLLPALTVLSLFLSASAPTSLADLSAAPPPTVRAAYAGSLSIKRCSRHDQLEISNLPIFGLEKFHARLISYSPHIHLFHLHKWWMIAYLSL